MLSPETSVSYLFACGVSSLMMLTADWSEWWLLRLERLWQVLKTTMKFVMLILCDSIYLQKFFLILSKFSQIPLPLYPLCLCNILSPLFSFQQFYTASLPGVGSISGNHFSSIRRNTSPAIFLSWDCSNSVTFSYSKSSSLAISSYSLHWNLEPIKVIHES